MDYTAHTLTDTSAFRQRSAFAALVYLLAVLGTGGAMYGFIWRQGVEPPATALARSSADVTTDAPVIAGTGAALPLLEALATRFEESGGRAIRVPPSIGSGGGLAALQDGLIDCAVLSREIRPEEAQGRAVVPIALAPLGLAAGRQVPDDAFTSPATLVSLLRNEQPSGSALSLVLREEGDSGQEMLATKLAGVADAISQARQDSTWPVAYTDADMERMLLERRNGVGVLDLGTIALHSLPLKALETPGGVVLERPFALVCSATGARRLRPFIQFLRSPPTRRWMAKFGYRPAED